MVKMVVEIVFESVEDDIDDMSGLSGPNFMLKLLVKSRGLSLGGFVLWTMGKFVGLLQSFQKIMSDVFASVENVKKIIERKKIQTNEKTFQIEQN